MDDKETVELLRLLVRYYREYGHEADLPSKMTVKDLAEDLIGSLPRELEPEGIEVLR